MARRKSLCLKWTLVLVIVILCPLVYSRPQETPANVPISVVTEELAVNPLRETATKKIEITPDDVKLTEPTTIISPPNSSRDVKTKVPIRDSIKLVASQLLDKPSNKSADTPIVSDSRIPPKIKTHLTQKHKIRTRNEDGEEPLENVHVGEAVPITLEEFETENKISESSTSNEGISTWILLSNPANGTSPTEPTNTEITSKKPKPTASPKPKRPLTKPLTPKRPIIGSTNKSDLVAGGSAISENVYNKLKDTVLSNVQKNKNASTQRTTTTISTTASPSTETTTRKITKAPNSVAPVVKVTARPIKKKNKNKIKITTPVAIIENESALLPAEAKEHEIELEVSTPPTTTKKPKRTSNKKTNKTKKRKTPKPESETTVADVKTSNKTKSAKPAKKPIIEPGAITSQLYNYFSREVMPTVGVGVIGLASLVGLASYFLYPFSTPVRRTFEVDKRDDLYKNNAEEYASEGNGQPEEEMLGTVLAGMPVHAKNKLNPYAGQTAYINRYPLKKEQDIRYRQVTPKYEPSYNPRYPQQKTGIAHGAVYSKPINYNPHPYETRNVYTTEGKYNYDKAPSSYSPYPAVEPIYAVPQTGPSAGSSYSSETSNSVVYGIKPSAESDFKPVYPYEGQFYGETTSSSVTYQPTSMYLGSNEEEGDEKYSDDSSNDSEGEDNKFVVGNVPKELADTATAAVVPEHGPRNLSRRKRNTATLNKRSISTSLEEILREKESIKDLYMINEIDNALNYPIRNLAPNNLINDENAIPEIKDVIPVYAVSVEPTKEEISSSPSNSDTIKVIESVSTLPLNIDENPTTEPELLNELDVTTKSFKVYEVFSTPGTEVKAETTTLRNMMTETTTDLKSETTSTMPPSPSPILDPISTMRPFPTTTRPDVITYPPLDQQGGFFTFLRRLVEFKYKLGLSILQTTSDSLSRYLRSMENATKKVAKASNK